MIKISKSNTIPLYYILEAAVNPADIKSKILCENTVNTADGNKIKTVTAESVLQSFEVINWNGRLYPVNVIMPALDNNPKIQNDIKMKQWAGEFGHPDSKDLIRMAMIMPERTSHYIDKYWKTGNLLMGQVTTAPYGNGISMYNTLMCGRPWGFSLRAFGGVDSNNVAILPMTIITYDEVNRPSHKDAYASKDKIVSVTSYTDQVLKECCETTLIESSNINKEVIRFVMDKSDNIKIAKDLFKLQEVNATVDGKYNIVLEGAYMGNKITVSVPIENYIKDNYLKIISL